jgi:hypothetical protein
MLLKPELFPMIELLSLALLIFVVAPICVAGTLTAEARRGLLPPSERHIGS